MHRNSYISRTGALLVLTGACGLALTGTARADEAREKDLEKRVEQLESQIETMRDEMRGGMATQYSSELEARVAELEKVAQTDSGGMAATWDNGLHFNTADKRFKFAIGGRLQHDFAFFNADSRANAALGQINTGSRFRRARMNVSGTVYNSVDFKAEYDFAGGGVGFDDVWIGFKDLIPFGYLTVGHQFEPFGLETQNSSKYTTFLERATVSSLQPGRNTGIKLSGTQNDGELGWGVGVFRNTNGAGDDFGNPDAGEWNFTGRVTHMGKMGSNDGQPHFYHVGASISRRSGVNHTGGFAARPESSIAPAFVSTGTIGVNDVNLYGLEAAYVAGPVSFQTEYTQARVDGDKFEYRDLGSAPRITPGPGNASRFDAWYAQLSYFVTGESRPYDAKTGTFGRVSPKKNHGDGDSLGAFEVATRYSEIDLTDGPIAGGEMDIITVGLNWYLNPVTKIMLDLSRADVKHLGNTDMVQIRFQIDW